MLYPRESVFQAVFLRRPNRFIAHCLLDGEEIVCHVKNTGRCQELLQTGAEVYLCKAPGGSLRKTAYDLIAVRKGERLINIDSQAPNTAACEFLKGIFPEVKAEVKFGSSRMDFCCVDSRGKHFVEVKGVTLEKDGAVFFPDAPTERGVRHIKELISAVAQGYSATILFVIQMQNVSYFSPNQQTDAAFAEALREAASRGVNILAYDCLVTPDSIELHSPVKIRL